MIFESLGITPVSSDHPTGTDVRALPDYEALNAEVEKLNSPSASGTVNWQRIVELSSTLLATQGKDLQVACFLGVGLVQTREVEGFSIGLKILGDLINSYWDTMFPPPARLRGRRNALEWWSERSVNILQTIKVEPMPLENLLGIKQRFAQLDQSLQEKDPEGISLNRLVSIVNSFPAQAVAAPSPNGTAQGAPAASANGVAAPLELAAGASI